MKLAALAVIAVTAAVAALPGAASAQTLNVVGQSNLGGGGANGEVAVVGDTAVVASGVLAGGGLRSGLYNPAPCPTTSIKVVNLSNPSSPSVASTIPIPDGQVAQDVAALRVSTPSFTGDLAAVAFVSCRSPGGFTDRGIRYYNVTNRADPQFLGRYDADFDLETPTQPPCGPPPGGSGARCASSQDEVALVQRPDGRVLSLSTEPFASASQFPSGDLRVVDVTNPASPTQVGSFPNGNQQPPPYIPPGGAANPRGFSNNGCRPFDGAIGVGATPDGSQALLPFFDAGMLTVDLSNPASPAGLGQLPFPRDDRAFEGNAARAAFASANGRSLALLSESDFIAPETRLRIAAPASLAGSKFACESMFTLFDPENTAQIYRAPGGQIPGEIVYVGRGCTNDPYLTANVTGKIVMRDRATVANRQSGLGGGCSAAAAVKRAQEAGAIAVITAQTVAQTPQAFSFDGDPAGLTIPMAQIDKGDADALRDVLCPVPATPNSCGAGGQTVSGSLVDSRGSWGGLRVADITDAAAPTQVSEYHSPTANVFPPPDLGVYSIHHAVARGSLAYVAANSDGVRALNVACSTPQELGSFVPPDTADPTGFLPRKAYVTGVDFGPGGRVVITDINSGLYVLSAPQGRACPAGPSYPRPYPVPDGVPPARVCPAASAASAIRGTAAANRITGTVGADRILAAGGNDVVDALAGNDCVDLGTGNDRGEGGSGGDRMAGGRGRDRMSGSAGNDRLRGGQGNDRLLGGRGNDRAFGDAGSDVVLASFGNDVLHGVAGNDRLSGSRGRDRINGGAGNDRIAGGSSPDRVRGDRGNDRVDGNSGRDRIAGNSGNDRIGARDGARDRVDCGPGRDRVVADRVDRVARNCERVRRR